MSLNVLRWISAWIILIPFTYKEILQNLDYIKKNILIIGFMGVMTISTFNSVVYYALNYTQVINAVLVLAAIPAATIVLSSIMKIEKISMLSTLQLSILKELCRQIIYENENRLLRQLQALQTQIKSD